MAPRTSGITQNPQENEQPSWILTNARTRSSRASAWTQPIAPTSPATNAAVSSGAASDHDDVGRQAFERAGREIRGAAGQVDAVVAARGAGGGLAALRDGLVRDAAAVDHDDVGVGPGGLGVPVREQAFADLVCIDVRDLAAQEFDAESHRCGDRTVRPAAWRAQRLAWSVTSGETGGEGDRRRGEREGRRHADAGRRGRRRAPIRRPIRRPRRS